MQSRQHSYAYMRAVSALAIVFLHTFQYNAEVFSPMGSDKIVSIALRNAMLWAVPVFVMVTGALLLDSGRELTYHRLFFRYVLKTTGILVLAVFLCRGMDQFLLGTEPAENGKYFLYGSLRAVLTADGWTPLWYLYLMLAIYVSLPGFRLIVKNAAQKDLYYLAAMLFLFQAVLGGRPGESIGFYSLFYTVYPLYLLLGYLFAKKSEFGKELLPTAGFAVVLCFLINAIITVSCFLYGWTVMIREVALYSFPITVLQASGIFLLFRCGEKGAGKKKENGLKKLLLSVDRCTLEIYLIHLFLLRAVFFGMEFDPYAYGIWMVAAEAVALFSISFALAWMLHGACGRCKGVFRKIFVFKKQCQNTEKSN